MADEFKSNLECSISESIVDVPAAGTGAGTCVGTGARTGGTRQLVDMVIELAIPSNDMMNISNTL